MKQVIYFILALAALIVTIHWAFATNWKEHEPIVGILVSIPAVMVSYENLPKPKSWPSFRWFINSLLRRIFEFLSSRTFLRNLAGAMYVLLMMYFTMTGFLRIYTNHGKTFQVPDFIGLETRAAVERAKDYRFLVKLDSLYVHDKRPGEIYRQQPAPFARVKKGRTLYMAYTLPYGVEVFFKPTTPSFKNAKKYLEEEGIYVYKGDTVFDDSQQGGSIVEALVKGEVYSMAELQSNGIRIRQGESIKFQITETGEGSSIKLPNLVCKTFDEALFLLEASNLKVGNIQPEEKTSGELYVWKQEPAYSPDKLLPMGTKVDLYLKPKQPDKCQ